MNAFWALVAKDIKLFLGDRRAVIVTLAVPIAIGSFFGFLTGGQSGKPKTSGVRICVVDQDDSAVTREILTNLQNDASVKVTVSTAEEARRQVARGDIAVAVIFPKGFGEEAGRALFAGGKKPVIALPHDPSRNMEVSMVKGILMQQIMQVISQRMFGGEGGRELVRDSIARLDENSAAVPAEVRAELREMLKSVDKWMAKSQGTNGVGGMRSGGMSVPFETASEELSMSVNGQALRYNGFAHSFGGMGVQFVLMAAIDMGIGILMERQHGLWKRLRAAPLSRFMLLLSRMASSALIGFFTLVIIFTFAMVVFHVRINGSVPGFLLCCAAIAIFAASLGLLIGSIGKTPQATRGIAIFTVLILVMLGGAWIPSFIFPEWLQSATLVMPTRWAVDGLGAMTWRGLGIARALTASGVLLGYAVAFVLLALWRFRWETD